MYENMNVTKDVNHYNTSSSLHWFTVVSDATVHFTQWQGEVMQGLRAIENMPVSPVPQTAHVHISSGVNRHFGGQVLSEK